MGIITTGEYSSTYLLHAEKHPGAGGRGCGGGDLLFLERVAGTLLTKEVGGVWEMM